MIDALFRTNLETVSANTKNQFPKYGQNSLDDTHDGAFVFFKAAGLQAGKRLNFVKPFRTSPTSVRNSYSRIYKMYLLTTW